MKESTLETPEQFKRFLVDQINDTRKCRDLMNKEVGDTRIEEFRGKQRFLQNLLIASITLLGFVSAFLTINESREIIRSYLIGGVTFHLFLECFIIIYLRESIDKDLEGLQKLQDVYSGALENKIKLAEESLSRFINDPIKNIQKSYDKYHQEISTLESLQDLKTESRQLNAAREGRKNNTEQLEFIGEIPVFCFVCGTIFIFLSNLGIYLSANFLIFGIILIFYFTFTDSLYKWLKYIFNILTFITRRKF